MTPVVDTVHTTPSIMRNQTDEDEDEKGPERKEPRA